MPVSEVYPLPCTSSNAFFSSTAQVLNVFAVSALDFLAVERCVPPVLMGENPVQNPEFPGLLVHMPFQKPFQTILSSKSPLNVCHVVST